MKKNNNTVWRFFLWKLTLSLGLFFFSFLITPVATSHATEVFPEVDEYADEVYQYIYSTMREQYTALINGEETQAKIVEANPKYNAKDGIKTYVEFHFERCHLGENICSMVMCYVEEAMDADPLFCGLTKHLSPGSWNLENPVCRFKVGSFFDLDGQREIISTYRSFIDKMLVYPRQMNVSEVELLMYIHDQAAAHVSYDHEGESIYRHSALGSMYGKAVCDGYSIFFNHLMRGLGFTSRCIRSNNHEWNIVKIRDHWYHVDVTWDDCEKYNLVVHWYFLVPCVKLSANHHFDKKRFPGLEEDSLYNSTFVDYAPKDNSLRGMLSYCEADNAWYFDLLGTVYRWVPGEKAKRLRFKGDDYYLVAPFHGKVYIAGEKAIYLYDPVNNTKIKISDDRVKRFIVAYDSLQYTVKGGEVRTLCAPE